MKLLALVLTLVPILALASGPVAPAGWNVSAATRLPNGDSCCVPADLNGTKLVGGAFVLISDANDEFALFALTYTPPLKEHWQLLERHPISDLSTFRVSIVPPGRFPFASIRACPSSQACQVWFTPKAGKALRSTR